MPYLLDALEIVMNALFRLTMFVVVSILFLTYLLLTTGYLLEDLQGEIYLMQNRLATCIANEPKMASNANDGLYG